MDRRDAAISSGLPFLRSRLAHLGRLGNPLVDSATDSTFPSVSPWKWTIPLSAIYMDPVAIPKRTSYRFYYPSLWVVWGRGSCPRLSFSR